MYTKSIVDKMAVYIEKSITNVRKCVRQLWGTARVETFGSYSTGMWLPSSDVDLVVLGVTQNNVDTKESLPHLQRLAAMLKKEKWVESIHLVETAKVPVIKLKR